MIDYCDLPRCYSQDFLTVFGKQRAITIDIIRDCLNQLAPQFELDLLAEQDWMPKGFRREAIISWDLLSAKVRGDLSDFSTTEKSSVQKWFQSFLLEYLVVGFKLFQENPQEFNPMNGLPCLQLYRGCDCAQIGWKILRAYVDINSDSGNNIINPAFFGGKLGQDSTNLAVIDQAVIGPFNE